MYDDAESDGMVETLWQGLLAVKFSRGFKQRICALGKRFYHESLWTKCGA